MYKYNDFIENMIRDWEITFPRLDKICHSEVLHSPVVVSHLWRHSASSTETQHIVEIPMLGVIKEDISVTLEKGVLTVAYDVQTNSWFPAGQLKHYISPDFDENTVKAEFLNGVLRVSLQRYPKKAPKKIVVS